MSTLTVELTTQDKVKTAFRAIRKLGIAAKFNVAGCCRSCIAHDTGVEHGEDHQIVWHYGGQGNRIVWDGGEPYAKHWLSSGYVPENRMYLNHSLTPENAELVLKTLRDHGLTVEWDGSEHRCIEVVFRTDDDA